MAWGIQDSCETRLSVTAGRLELIRRSGDRRINRGTTGVPPVTLLDELDRDTISGIEAIAATRVYPKNAVIIHQGDDSDAFYVVLSGRLEALIVHEDGRQIVLGTLAPGDYFGEMSCLNGDSRSATIMAREPCKCLVISRTAFHSLCHEHPSLIWVLVRDLVRKLRRATRRIEELAFTDVYGRVARYLTEVQDEALPVERRVTHQDIAYAVGASREMVSRVMKDLAAKGYIEQAKGRVKVLKNPPIDSGDL